VTGTTCLPQHAASTVVPSTHGQADAPQDASHLLGHQSHTQPQCSPWQGGGVCSRKNGQFPLERGEAALGNSSSSLAFPLLCPQPDSCPLHGTWDQAPTMGSWLSLSCSLVPLLHPPWGDARLQPCPSQHRATGAGMGWGRDRVMKFCCSDPVSLLQWFLWSITCFLGMRYPARASPSSGVPRVFLEQVCHLC